jgi:hypothetical protein
VSATHPNRVKKLEIVAMTCGKVILGNDADGRAALRVVILERQDT